MNEHLPWNGQKKRVIFTKDIEEVVNQNYQFSEVRAVSSQKGNVLLPLRIYYHEVGLNLLLTVLFHINLPITIIIIIIIIMPPFCLYYVLILVSF